MSEPTLSACSAAHPIPNSPPPLSNSSSPPKVKESGAIAKASPAAKNTALHRLPIRKDIYTGDQTALLSHPDALPYEDAEKFTYHPEWTAGAFNAIRFLVRVMCVDTHHELSDAWEHVFLENFPPDATATLLDLRIIGYDSAIGRISEALKSKDKIREVTLANELGALFRSNYAKAKRLAQKRQ